MSDNVTDLFGNPVEQEDKIEVNKFDALDAFFHESVETDNYTEAFIAVYNPSTGEIVFNATSGSFPEIVYTMEKLKLTFLGVD